MKSEDQKNNAEASGEKQNNSTTNDIRSRLRKNPNKTKPLYTDDFTEKKNKQKKTTDSSQNSLEIAKNILEDLKKDEKSSLFRQSTKYGSENEKDRNHSSKINEIRDLGNITKKMKSKKYSLKEFFDDLELCWSNAEKFNDENSEAFANAKYMRELSHKLFKEKGVLDLVFNTKNSVKEENKKSSNPQIEVNEEPIKTAINNNNVGKKRKRTESNNEAEKVKSFDKANFNFNNTNNNGIGKNKKRGNSSKNILSIKDVKTKLNIKNDVPFLTTILNIPTLFDQKPLDNLNNIFNNQSHKNHHTSVAHFINKDKNNNVSIFKIADLEKYRKIIFEWKEEIKPTISKKFLIQKINLDIPNSEKEKKQMDLFDENCNIENIYDLSSYKGYLNKTPIQKNEQFRKQSLKYDNNKQNNCSYNTNKTTLNKQIGNSNNIHNNNIKECKETGSQNMKKATTEKENEYLKMKHLIAKQLDKLNENNIIDVLVYIENIRPNAIKLFPNDSIYIDMDLFSTETFDKLTVFLKKFS